MRGKKPPSCVVNPFMCEGRSSAGTFIGVVKGQLPRGRADIFRRAQ